ncbi:MAG TPA: glycosyltransferase [Vicinamibacteria bacterium]|nr:glycosyltransferase [Vicinamibacteria bacterium]
MSRPQRVLVVTSGALFVRGGHLVIAEETAAALRRAGHLAEVLVTPQNRFGRQFSAYLATWLTDVGETADGQPVDRVISFRFPSYAVRHPRHVCWLNHRMREYYDLWDHFVRGLGRKGRLKESLRRRLFHLLDRRLLNHNVTRLLAQSKTIQARLKTWGGIGSELLYPPPPERPYRTQEYGDYVFAVSRLTRLKRLGLLVEAVARMEDRSLGFKIAGTGEEEPRLRERIRELGLEDRVELLGAVSDQHLLEHYARCRAVFFAPWNEDYGFVTLEAFRSGKPVVTTLDSGGPAELVRHGETGWVGAPTPEALAVHLDAIARDRGLSERLGQAALEASRSHTWAAAVEELLRLR